MAKKEGANWFMRHKILTVILAIIMLAIIGGAVSGGSKTNTSTAPANTTPTNSSSSGSSSSKKQSTAAKLNEPARDGKFEFVVKSVTCGKPSVSDSSGYVTKTAQGQYCLMVLTVKNIGDSQQYFSESDQKILNNAKQQFSADTAATLTLSNNSDTLLSQINPGNSVEGTLVFDIPKDQTPVTAELHDSGLSNGVVVNLQ